MRNDESSAERMGGGSTEMPPEQKVNRGLAWVIGAL